MQKSFILAKFDVQPCVAHLQTNFEEVIVKKNFESFRFFILREFSDEITAAFKNFPYICQHQTIFGTQ